MIRSTRKDLVYSVSWSTCHIETLDVGIYWSGNINACPINMNSCQQDQWKKRTDLFNRAAPLRPVARCKTLQVPIFSWDLKGLTYWQSWWILLRTKRKTDRDDWVPVTQTPFWSKKRWCARKVLLHRELWGQSNLNESFSLIYALRSGWFPIITWRKKHFNFLFPLELFFQRMHFSPYWVLNYQMLMHIL